jgi:mono/diheme cytochrome c family protein
VYIRPKFTGGEPVKNILKWIGIVFGGLIALVMLIAIVLYTKSRTEFTKKYDVNVETVSVPTDAASIEHGQHLATILCMECHAKDLGGTPDWFNGGPMGGANTPNLTTGKGGLGSQLTDTDLVRVLRHGVKPDGTSVFIMPAQDFYHMSDKDLGDLIAYIRSIQPVNRVASSPQLHFTFMGNVMYGAGVFGNLLRAGEIDQVNRPAVPAPAVSSEYGEYLVSINGCHDCHGAQLAGGKPGDPGSPLAPNLTPGGELRAWSEVDFVKTLRTGVSPTGTNLPDRYMPWMFKSQMTDNELNAVWMYLQSLPSLPTSTAPAE